MSPNDKTAPAAKTKAPRAAKAVSGRASKIIEKLRARVLKTDEWATKVGALFAASADAAGVGSSIKKHGHEAVAAAAKIQAASTDLGKALYGLSQAGWAPPDPNAFRIGDLVRFREGRVETVTADGAYEAKDLAELAVVSIHGKRAKLKTGANVQIGTYPMTWLARAPVAEKK